MSGFDPVKALSEAGQDMAFSVGAFTIRATLHQIPGASHVKPLHPSAAPAWSNAVFGADTSSSAKANYYFFGDSSFKPVLYQSVAGERKSGDEGGVELSNISVVNSAGQPVKEGFSFVMADGESTNNHEVLRFASNVPVNLLSKSVPAGFLEPCGGGLTGLGSNSVQCTGASDRGVAEPVGVINTVASEPQTVSIRFTKGVSIARQGAAFGVMFSRVEVKKTVNSRYNDADQFVVSGATEAGEVAAVQTTGSQVEAVVGARSLLTQLGTTRITFTEKPASSGTDLAHYSKSWQCFRNGEAVPSEQLLVSTDHSSVSTESDLGDFVSCSVTNTALLGSLLWSKIDAGGRPQSGSQWILTGPDGSSATVVDNGLNDADPRLGMLNVSGLRWGSYFLQEVNTSPGSTAVARSVRFTVDADHLSINLSDVASKPGAP